MNVRDQIKEWRKLNPVPSAKRMTTLQSIIHYREELKHPVKKIHETTIPTTKELFK